MNIKINQCSQCDKDLPLDFTYTKEECKLIANSIFKGIYYKIGLSCHECLRKLKEKYGL